MKNPRRLRIIYASLLQLEYVLALVVGVLIGGSHWLIGGIALVLCLLLGFATTALYWILFDKGIK